jgi:hypothetical protein
MSQMHKLITAHGTAEALRMIEPEKRAAFDIAARIMSEEDGSMGTVYTGFCLTALPHRRIPDDQKWHREGHKVQLQIEPGDLRVEGEIRTFGVPYGSRARLLLIYLQSEAKRTGSPEVELGPSMNSWLDRMEIPSCGKAYRDTREQLYRLMACTLRFFWETESGGDGNWKDSIVNGSTSEVTLSGDDRQGKLWRDTLVLSPTFFGALQKHGVPIWEPAVRALSGKSMALDIYVWLAYRLHVLQKPLPITWAALHGQFGTSYKHIRQFKPEFLIALEFATAVYPEANVTIDEGRIVMNPSHPPIPERLIIGPR